MSPTHRATLKNNDFKLLLVKSLDIELCNFAFFVQLFLCPVFRVFNLIESQT